MVEAQAAKMAQVRSQGPPRSVTMGVAAAASEVVQVGVSEELATAHMQAEVEMAKVEGAMLAVAMMAKGDRVTPAVAATEVELEREW